MATLATIHVTTSHCFYRDENVVSDLSTRFWQIRRGNHRYEDKHSRNLLCNKFHRFRDSNETTTEFPIPSFIEIFWLSFREFPGLVGRYCS